MLQTPTVVMTCESPEQMRARAERNGYKNGTKYGSLESQVNYDPRFTGLLLPTPQTSDCQAALTPEQKEDYVKKWKEKGIMPSAAYQLRQQAVEGLLPTPTARDFKNPSDPEGERIARKRELGYTVELNDLAAMEGMLPTPSARDWKGKTNPGTVKEGSGCVYGETLPDAIDRIASSKKLLPTPLAVDIQHKRRVDGLRESGSEDMYSRRNGDSRPNGLMDYLHFNGMLPTPLTRDYKGGSTAVRKDTGKIRTDALDSLVKIMAENEKEPTVQSESAGQTSRLSPLFTEEMMGFPLMWTTFPFLSPSGEPSPSKPTETP